MTFEQMIAGTRTDHRPFPELRGGNLGVRVACSAAEIDAVQALRYRVFYQEMGAKADVGGRCQPARPRRVRCRGGPSAGGGPCHR